MPSRWISLVILIYWSIAAFCLFSWDVLPELTLGYPPDLRAIAFAGDSSKPVRWSIEVIDDPRTPDVRRPVGEAVTSSARQPDGWYELRSRVEFDAGGLLRGMPFASRTTDRFQVESQYHVDPSGNLQNFGLNVKSREFAGELWHVTGQLRGKFMEIVSRGPVPLLNQQARFEYEPRSVVQNVLGPIDRLPGLHVGQRWETRGINPFSQQVERVRVEVAGRTVIHWEGNALSTFEVVQNMGPLSMRTWVRPDGLVLRHEVPFPYCRLVLDRQSGEAGARAPSAAAGGRAP